MYCCCYIDIGTDSVSIVADATKQLQQRCVSSRCSSTVDEWPPYQRKHYTTLAFIHDKSKFTDAVRFSVAQELAVAGNINISQFYGHSNLNANMTKNISDIFLPVTASDGSFIDLHILIEGAPGIGKTVLAKEIAYQWAKNELLTSKRLLLLVFLRECHQIPLKSVEDLVQHVFVRSKITTGLADYLLQTEGEDTVIIFDGFDELPEERRKKSIIVDIIHRRILTKSCLVITSRPTASSSLHGSVDRRVEIVGFTEEDRLDYIKTALENHDEQVKALQHYLQSNPTINALCYIPLNMTILLCLVEDGIDRLPKTQTEMYKRFTETTIIRFIKKYENCDTIISIAKLPHPYDKLLTELARLAYKALKTDKIVFTLPEIKEGCPNLTLTSNNWNGLGLLKAVQCYNREIGNDQVTFHFLHFSIQEYMAAWYISTLSDRKQIRLLQKTFWKHRYYNTWIMYVGITSGCTFALQHYLSGNWFQLYSKIFGASKVSIKFLKHKMKCLHLFQCLVEADKVESMKQFDSVKELFQNNQIDLRNQTLLPSDLNTLGFFLIRSINKEWDGLNLSNCSIGSNGSNVLCDRLLDKDVRCIVTIKKVNFSYNQLGFSSLMRLFALFNSWHTSELIITDDASLGKTTDLEIEDTVLQSSTLVLVQVTSWLFCKNAELSKICHILSSTTNIRSVYLLNCTWMYDSEILKLLKRQKLHKVRIISSFLETVFFKTVVSILLNNNDFVNMFVYDPTMSDQIADDISSLITSSDKDISGVMLIVSSSKVQGIVNTCSLSNELSTLEIFNLSRYIRYLNTEVCQWREHLEGENHKMEMAFTFIKLLHKVNFNLKIILWENDILIVHKIKLESLDNFEHFTDCNSVIYLSNCNVSKLQYDVIIEACSTIYILNSPDCVELLHAKLLLKNFVPNKLFIHGNIHCTYVNNLVELLSPNHNILAVLAVNGILVGLHPNSELIALAFQLQPSPTRCILNNKGNNMSDIYQMIDALTTIPQWAELDFTGCDIGDVDCEVLRKSLIHNNCSTVRMLNISFNKLSVSGIRDLAKIILILGVQQVIINGTNDVLLDYLIKKLICECQTSFFLSITYNLKIFILICNTSWNKVATEINTQASELYIINCDLLLNSTRIINYFHMVHNLLRLCINNGSVSVIVITKIFEFFSNKSIEISLSNISIIDDGEVTRNLLTASYRNFCHVANCNLVVSTDDHWLCVYNVTKYQLHLIHQYFMNQTPPNRYGMILIRKLEHLSRNTMYIFDNNLVNLLYINGNNGNSIMNTTKEFITLDHKISAVLVSSNEIVVGIYPSSEQIAAVFHLQPSPTTWIQYTTVSVSVFYQIVDGLSILHTTWAELDFTHCNIGDVECEILYRNLRLDHSSTVRKLNISLNKLSISGITDLVRIILLWRVQELNINETNDVLYNCLIKQLTSEHHCDSFLSITYNHKVIVWNTDWNKTAIILNGLVSELHMINCNLRSNSKELISYLKTTHSLLRFCLINGCASLTVVIEILKICNQVNEVTISNVKIIDDDRIRNFIAQRKFYLGIKSSLMLSTTKWLCVHNITIYQLPLIHQYFMSQAHSDCYGMSLVRKLEQINGDKMYVFDNNQLTVVCVHAGVPQAPGATQIITALSDTVTLYIIEIDNYAITNETVYDLANILRHNTQLQELYLNGNCLHADSIIAKMLHSVSTSSVCKNHTTNDVASNYTVTKTSATSAANLEASDSTTTIKAVSLHSIVTLTKFSISNNRITDKAASSISAVISNNIHLQEVNLGYNNLEASGIIKIAGSLQQKISSLTKLYINHNSITHEAANDIAAVISCNTGLQEIDVSKNHLQTIGAKKIAKALGKNSALEKLNLSNNNITGEAAGDIANAIIFNTKLQEIDISENYLLTAGVQEIMKALQGINTLRKLCLSNNNVTGEAADDIAAVVFGNTSLQVIDVSGNDLQTNGAINIAKALRKNCALEKLNLSNNNIADEAADDIAAVISCNTTLQEIDVSGNHLQTRGAKMITMALVKIYAPEKLNLSNNNITGDIMAAILFNTKLQELDISNNNLLTTGAREIMKALQGINTLRKLCLSNNNITGEAADDVAAVLFCNTSLQEIDVSGNNLQTRGSKKIAKALGKIPALEKLNLSNNNITGEAADDIAAAILFNTKLQEIDISENYLLTVGIRKIMKALQGICTLRKLCLRKNNITGKAVNDIAAVVTCNTSLQQIDISGNYLQTSGAINFAKALRKNCALKKLNLSNNNITDKAADDIAAVISCNTSLQEIDVSRNHLQTPGTKKITIALVKIPTTEKLNLSNNNITGEAADDIAAVISYNTSLQEIDVSRNNLQTIGAKKIAKALGKISALKKLNLSNNNITGEAVDDITDVIFFNTKLQEIDISGNYLLTAGVKKIMKALQGINTLRKLCLGNNNITGKVANDITAVVSCNTSLQQIDISRSNLQTSGVINIAKALSKICALEKLNLSNNNITGEAADDISAAISSNTKLQEIDISENIFFTADVRKIVEALQGINTLRKLCLRNNNVTGEAADDIAAVISYNTSLQKIDVSRNHLQTIGAKKIAKALGKIYALEKLNLSNNNITGEAADDIAAAVSCNTSLQKIDISRNDLQSKGIIKIVTALQQTYGVKKLCLSSNNITDIAADNIAIVIILHHMHLQEFHISGNKLSTVGAIKIAKALQHVFSLKVLYISDNKIDSTAAYDIATAISHANQLHELDISKNNFKARGIEIILKPLQNCDKLTKLYISDNNVTDDTIAHDVGTVISRNTGLQEIDVSGNNLQARGAINVAVALQSIVMLTKLCISNNNITHHAANDIAIAITCNVHLQHLSIGGSDLLTEGATIIAKSLQKISTLKKLYINNNKITSAAVDDIAVAVSCNPHLEEFDISENEIEGRGAIKLAKSFQKISLLKKLFVDHNRITDEAADDFASVISHNPHLIAFKINGNLLQNVKIIKDAFYTNRNLTEIDIQVVI